ncbi:MAG: response regulator [Acidobacteriota bacterium]|nr:MAG: response regulator [Acidobacteriota bacterium]
MSVSDEDAVSLLIGDAETDSRTAVVGSLTDRGFVVDEATTGQEVVEKINRGEPDVLILDFDLAGIGGIEALQEIRRIAPRLPVILMTRHGGVRSALEVIQFEIVDFVNKPVDIEYLVTRIRRILRPGAGRGKLRETTIAELMVPVDRYRRVTVDEPVETAVRALLESVSERRSILVFDRSGHFLGMIRFQNLLRLVVPAYLADLPHPAYFTGMCLAQCKLLAQRGIAELIDDDTTVDVSAPLIEAIHKMVIHNLINVPVVDEGRLVGVLREREIVAEIAAYFFGK